MVRMLIVLIIYSCSAAAQVKPPLKKIRNFGSNPGELNMYLHAPCHAVDTVSYRKHKPLVVALHGCNQDAPTLSRQSGWNKLADEFDFYVIYPEQRRLNNPSDCFNWFLEKDNSPNSGESGSIRQMIRFMYDSLKIDTSQVYVYGLSAGAAMTCVMMATYPSVFRAGAILAGGPYKMADSPMEGLSAMMKSKDKSPREWGDLILNDNKNYTGKYPRVVIVHGKNDKIVNPKNSLQLIKQWSYVLKTDTVPTETMTAFTGHKDVTKFIYRDHNKQEQIYYYEIEKLGHSLCIDPGEEVGKGGETGLFSTDKDFFSTYWIAKDFGLVR